MADRYENYTRSELMAELRDKETHLRNWKIKPDPTDETKKTAQKQIITDLDTVVKQLEERVKNTSMIPSGPTGNPPNQAGTPNQQMLQEWSKAHKRQLIAQDVSAVGKLVVSNLERWIAEIDRIHTLEIADDIDYAEDFCKMVKRQLSPTIYSQLTESGVETKSWSELRSYLVLNFGSKISIYQHLTKLNDLELTKNENWTGPITRIRQLLAKKLVYQYQIR